MSVNPHTGTLKETDITTSSTDRTTAPRAIPNVGALVAKCAKAWDSRVAVRSGNKQVSYRELEQRSNRLANALLAMGANRGSRIGIYLPNCIEIVEVELACYKAGLVKAPFNARLSPTEAGEIIDNSEAGIVVTTRARAESFLPHVSGPKPALLLLDDTEADGYEGRLAAASDQFVPVAVTQADLAVLHYTSGSSGVLKAAMQTFGNRLAQLRKFLMRDVTGAGGGILGLVGPVTHASGMQIVPALCSGMTISLYTRFEPRPFLDQLRADRVTHTFMVPTMINMLLAELEGQWRPLPDLQRLGYGAAPMAPARIMRAMDVFGPVLAQGYGAGETTSAVCALSAEDHLFARAAQPELLASCGRPLLECEIRVVDESGNEVATGEIGEMVVGGDDVFAGYWRAPELTAEVLKNGYYHTGDLARADERGYLYIVDRKKDMVISGGFNVYPSEVEAVLYQHDAIQDACVFAKPDDKWGETVAAHVVLKPGRTLDEHALTAFCDERLAHFKRPRFIRFVGSVPKNNNGKIMRRTVQQAYWSDRERKVN